MSEFSVGVQIQRCLGCDSCGEGIAVGDFGLVGVDLPQTSTVEPAGEIHIRGVLNAQHRVLRLHPPQGLGSMGLENTLQTHFLLLAVKETIDFRDLPKFQAAREGALTALTNLTGFLYHVGESESGDAADLGLEAIYEITCRQLLREQNKRLMAHTGLDWRLTSWPKAAAAKRASCMECQIAVSVVHCRFFLIL